MGHGAQIGSEVHAVGQAQASVSAVWQQADEAVEKEGFPGVGGLRAFFSQAVQM